MGRSRQGDNHLVRWHFLRAHVFHDVDQEARVVEVFDWLFDVATMNGLG